MKDLQKFLTRLHRADRVTQGERGSRFLLRVVLALFAAILFSFTLDAVLHLSPKERVILLGVMVLIAVGGFALHMHIRFGRKNPDERVARMLEKHEPKLGTKLMNMLQLREQVEDEQLAPLTRQLADQAVAAANEEISDIDFQQVAKTDLVKRQAKQTLWGTLAFCAILGIGFKVTQVELLRFFDPFGGHPPFSFTQLEITEPGVDGADVVYGDGFLVKASHSGHKPKELFLTFFPVEDPGSTTTVAMYNKGDLGFAQKIDNIKEPLRVVVHTKTRHSISRDRMIDLILTPRLEQARVTIRPPAYTHMKPFEKPMDFKTVRALAGSELEFRLGSNRPLKSGSIEKLIIGKDPETFAMTPRATHEVSRVLKAEESARLKFKLVDEDAIASEESWETALTVTHDLPPSINIVQPPTDTFVSIAYKLKLDVQASDDYGLSKLRVHRALNGVYSAPKVVTYDTNSVHKSGGFFQEFDFVGLGVKAGDIISVYAEAIDNCPNPHITRTDTIRFGVITEEEYNEQLRRERDMADMAAKYDDLMYELDKLIEEQRQVMENLEKLQKQLAEAETDAERAKLEEQFQNEMARQAEINRNLEKLGEHMKEFVRENPLYDLEKDIADSLEDFARQMQESAEQNQQSMQEMAGQQAQAPMSEQNLEKMRDAAREQLEKLGGVQEQAEEQVAQPLEDLSDFHDLVKNLGIFQELYNQQKELSEQLKAYDRDTPLSREDQLSLKDLAAQEKQIGENLEQLEKRLREGAEKAEEHFPKAAQGARDLADAMEQLALGDQAGQATGQMLAAQGAKSYALAEGLRADMESLFGESGNCKSCMGDSLDQYLALMKMNPGNNLEQMMQSRKFGQGLGQRPGMAMGMGGQGSGQDGQSGYSIATQPQVGLMGGEAEVNNNATDSSLAGNGLRTEGQDEPDKPALDYQDAGAVEDFNELTRQSEAVAGETVVEEYRSVVEEYFEQITTERNR